MKTCTLVRRLIPLMPAFLTGLLLVSCRNNDFPAPGTLPKGLTGSWVEIHNKSDTLIFNSNNNTGICMLQRGFEIRNGYRLPITGTTEYRYEIFSDRIHMLDKLSGELVRGIYSFRFDEPNLTINIGKFSKYIDTKKSTLTFRKIK
jgi:hypothetical protein